MAKTPNKPAEEEVQSTGDWIVTFSDCMTLLLCFFVMLLTFSSFDEAALKRFGGAFPFDSLGSVIEETAVANSSMYKPPVHLQDRARQGSDKPSNSGEGFGGGDSGNAQPRSVWIADDDAYRDRRVLRISSDRLFGRGGNNLTAAGRAHLAMLARFMRRVGCQAIVSESSRGLTLGRRRRVVGAGLQRAWSIMDHLVKIEDLPPQRLRISATHLDGPAADGAPMVEIVLLAHEVCQ